MKIFAAALLLVASAMGQDDKQISFGSKRIIGTVVKDMDVLETLTITDPNDGSYDATKPTRLVAFSSARETGGNFFNKPDNTGLRSFGSKRMTGTMEEPEEPAYSEKMQAARAARAGVSFRSKRVTGDYANLDEEEPWYTLLTDAVDEEDWAVTTATLCTFFATWFVAMILGLIVGMCCCMPTSKCFMCCGALGFKGAAAAAAAVEMATPRDEQV